MADNAVQEVLAVNSYKGDSTAGGMQTFGVKLDATPFDKLAEYTFLQNREKWERRNTLNDDAAKKMASTLAIDINTPIPEYYSFLQTKQKELNKFIEGGHGLIYEDDPEANKEYNRKYAELVSLKNKAVSDGLKLNAEYAAIEQLPTQSEKDVALKTLEINKQELLKDGAETALTQKPLLKTGARYTKDQFDLPRSIGSHSISGR